MGRLMLTRKAEQGLRFTIKPEHLDSISDLIRQGITVTISDVTECGNDSGNRVARYGVEVLGRAYNMGWSEYRYAHAASVAPNMKRSKRD